MFRTTAATLFLHCLIASFQLIMVDSESKLYVQFLQYTSTGRLANGALCDPTAGTYDPCDPRFRVWVGYSEESAGSSLAYQTSYDNTDGFTFATQAKKDILPARQLLVGKYVWMIVEVADLDSGVDSGLMGRFSSRLSISPTAADRDLVFQNSQLRLTLRYWFLCEQDYYGEYCDVFCRKNEPYSICDQTTGAKICLYGWVSPSSSCYTKHPCRTCVCKNGGICVPQGLEGYRCMCRGGFTGINCESCSTTYSCSPFYESCDLCNSCDLANLLDAFADWSATTTICPIPKDDIAFQAGVAIGVILDVIMVIVAVKIYLWWKKR